MIISVEEARKILGNDATNMTDEEIVKLVNDVDFLAKDALALARTQLRMKADAQGLAEVIYSEYEQSKRATS